MRRLGVPLSLAAALAVAAVLFYVKEDVRELERELARVDRAIADHREAVRVLRSEWSYLNQPARIAVLAKRHLNLQPLAPSQIVRLEDLPMRATAASAPRINAATRAKGVGHMTGGTQ